MRHKLDYARYQIRVHGLKFEVGNKYLLKQLTGFLIPEAPGLFTKIPMKSSKYEILTEAQK
jgi:hypothetical protein